MASLTEAPEHPHPTSIVKPKSHWTIYPSLLGTLENDLQISALEDAVCAHHCGRFEDARQIFDELLPHSSSLPILALERSDMQTIQGLEHERILLLQETLKNEQSWSAKATGGERELLSLLLADAVYWAHGTMKPLLREARNMQKWLAVASVDDLSDVKVRCIAAYYQVMKECRSQSNWVNDESDGILFPSLGQEPWTELSAVRRSLRAQDRLVAATRIAMVDTSVRNGLALQSLCEDLIELCEAMEASQEDTLLYKSCTTRLFVSELLRSVGFTEAADQNVSKAQENLKRLKCIGGAPWAQFSPRIALDLSVMAAHNASVSEDYRRTQFRTLAEEPRARADLTKQRQLFIASVNAAQAWHEKAGTSDSRQALTELEQDFLSWETSAGLAIFQAYALSRVLTTIRYTTSNWDEIITQYVAFDEQFPDFDVPGVRERLLHTTLSAAEQLKDHDLTKMYRKLHNSYWLQCAFSENDDEVVSQVKRVYRLTEAAQNDPLYYRREIHHPDPSQMCIRAVRVLLRWARNECEQGLISPAEALQIFGFIKVDGEAEEAPIDWNTTRDDQDPTFYEKVVIKMYGSPEPCPESEWGPRLQLLEDWLLLEDRPPFVEARHYILKLLQQARITKINDYWIKKNMIPDVNGAKQIMAEDNRLQSILSRITPEARSETDVLNSQGNMIKNTLVFSSVPNAVSTGLITDEKLQQALEVAFNLAEKYKSQERNKLEYFVQVQRARLLYYRYLCFRSVPAAASLAPLEQADAIFREQQREQSVLRGSRSLVAKTAVSTQLMQAALYDQALVACLVAYTEWSHGDFASGEKSGSHFINWIQRSKARALNDGIGLEAALPAEMISATEQSPQSKELQARESLMLQEFPDLKLQQKLKLRKALEELRIEMRKDPVLKPAMDFRDGTTITHEEIENMLSELGEGVVIVEYVHILYMGTMRIILYRAGSTQVFNVPDIRMIDVQAWVKEYLDVPPNKKKSHEPFYPLKKIPQAASDPYLALQKMNKLIEPLATVPKFTSRGRAEPPVKPGETIIFCPTKAIHRVPLHALTFAGAPLIMRNPVVYCQSLSVLRYCYLSSRDSSMTKSPPSKRTFLHLLPSHDHRSGENTTIASSYVNELARRMQSRAYVGYGSPKSAIIDAITSSSLLHYHGHVDFKPSRPLSSGLIIDDNKPESDILSSEPAPQPTAEVAIKSKPTLLTATEIFTTRLNKGAHVNLIGCESGLAGINPNDDLHGLVTAFHYAGASSVVSTLWSIDDDDGMIFSKVFFDSLRRQSGVQKHADYDKPNEAEGLLDIARATQEAILALRSEDGVSRDPYHWAGIVLNGYWQCPTQLFGFVEDYS